MKHLAFGAALVVLLANSAWAAPSKGKRVKIATKQATTKTAAQDARPVVAKAQIGPEIPSRTSNTNQKILWPERVLSAAPYDGIYLEIEQGRTRQVTFNTNIIEVVRSVVGCCENAQVQAVNARTLAVCGLNPGRSTLQVITQLVPGDKFGQPTNFLVTVLPKMPATGAAEGISEITLATKPGYTIELLSTSLTLRADGSATFVTDSFNRASHKHRVETKQGTFSVADFGRLARFLREQRFFQFQDHYPTDVSDSGSVVTGVVRDGVKKTVEADGDDGPFELWCIEQAIRRIARTVKWQKVDAPQ